MSGRSPTYSSPERVLDMLIAFAEPDTPHSVHSIARAFGTSRSSTYRYLQMLRKRALIEEEEGLPGHYRLGRRVADIARGLRAVTDVVTVAEPIMRALTAETGETTLLTRQLGSRVVCAACVESPQAVRISFEPARDLPLHAGSTARVHLAFLAASEIARLLSRPLERLTARTLTDPAAVRQDLAAIRRRGYAISEGEIDADVRSISVPVLAPRGRAEGPAAARLSPGSGGIRPGQPRPLASGAGVVVAGLTLAGPRFRLSRGALRQAAPRVLEAARLIGEAYAGAPAAPARGAERAAGLRIIRL
jgi:DNA-binding IclR family transcriptional regulator